MKKMWAIMSHRTIKKRFKLCPCNFRFAPKLAGDAPAYSLRGISILFGARGLHTGVRAQQGTSVDVSFTCPVVEVPTRAPSRTARRSGGLNSHEGGASEGFWHVFPVRNRRGQIILLLIFYSRVSLFILSASLKTKNR